MMEPSTGEVLGSIMVQEREPRGPVQVSAGSCLPLRTQRRRWDLLPL